MTPWTVDGLLFCNEWLYGVLARRIASLNVPSRHVKVLFVTPKEMRTARWRVSDAIGRFVQADEVLTFWGARLEVREPPRPLWQRTWQNCEKSGYHALGCDC